MMLTLPGVPFLYYGDEIGMRNLDGLPEKEGSMWRAANRTPMQWGPGANLGFSTAPAEKLYLPVDAAADAPTVAAQEQDPGSLLHLVRSLVALRKAHPAMGNDGGFTPLYAKPGQYPFVYERSTGEQRVVVVINPAGRATEADLGSHGLTGATPLLAEGVVITGDRVRCAPVSFGIFLR
jgi:maltose alpha-D-glucosyltransferase/alpha-amylase